MSADRPQNLQDTFLNFVRKNKVPLTIFLVNGVKLQGVVTFHSLDEDLTRVGGHQQPRCLLERGAMLGLLVGRDLTGVEGDAREGCGMRDQG